MSQSNRVGHPIRNRKKNRLIFNEDEETSFGSNRMPLYSISSSMANNMKSNNKQSISNNNNSTNKNQQQEESIVIYKGKFSKNIGNNLMNSLKTLLKLPKAYNWVILEWFYGSIDQVLFLDENEFSLCLKDSFPQLKTRYLTRIEWSQIRRLMGKPRRCSSSFFDEERTTLHTKHSKIRYLQQNKVADINIYKDLPEYLPQPLVVGNRVNALARQHEGLHFGTIEGINPSNGTYRVRFNRDELGSLTIPDYDISSSDIPQLAPLSSFQIKTRKTWNLSNRIVDSIATVEPHLLTSSSSSSSTTTTTTSIQQQQQQQQQSEIIAKQRSKILEVDQCIGGFPIKFLTYMVKASKILTLKKRKLTELQAMNTKIERMTTLSMPISYTFKKQYALTILDLERTNKELCFHLKKIQSYSLQIALDGKLKSLRPDVLTQKYQIESKQLIEKLQGKFKVSEKMRDLIINLMCLLVHLRGFRDCEISSHEFESLLKALSTIRDMIHRDNHDTFQNNVEIHIRHIMTCVSHLGNVGAFAESTTSSSLSSTTTMSTSNLYNNANSNNNNNNNINNNSSSNSSQSNQHHHHHHQNDMIKTEIN
ncbi:protein lin-9 homolog [Dermatophagoides farinae]|uniref:protein lin-9 homolog n=1 Tax=Dermatophagoides farinae TaxID=6954 RepID=UPI003F5F1C20